MTPYSKTNIEKLHFEHQLWTNELNFFYDEVHIYERRLEKLVQPSADKDMLAQLEHFQNQFIRQKEVLDQLKHDIKIQESHLADLSKKEELPEGSDVGLHEKLADRMATFRKIYGELKKEFYQFMTRWK